MNVEGIEGRGRSKLLPRLVSRRTLTKELLEATANELDLPLALVETVASFYPHFRKTTPAAIVIEVCQDMACELRGAGEIIKKLEGLHSANPTRFEVHSVSCLGRCDRGPAAVVNGRLNLPADLDVLEKRTLGSPVADDFQTDADNPAIDPSKWIIDPYRDEPDFGIVRQWGHRGQCEAVLEQLKVSRLHGMGGPGVLAHRKWGDVNAAQGAEKFVVCNADESEPSTFKDRELLMRKPHLVVEGMAIAARVLGARAAYVYVRHEYPEQIAVLKETVAALKASKAAPDVSFEVVTSPGGYICGEQSALIEAIEGKRAEPRNRPPQLETNGLWDCPTLLSNVETFAWVPYILRNGGRRYAEQGENGWTGRRFFSIAGDVRKPGVYEVPVGLSFGQFLKEYAGRCTSAPQAFAFSGPSAGFVPPVLDVPIPSASRMRKLRGGKASEDFILKVLAPSGGRLDFMQVPLAKDLFSDLGLTLSAGLTVFGQGRDMGAVALNATRFYQRESCGKCVPCRQGTEKLVALGERLFKEKLAKNERERLVTLVQSLDRLMDSTSICGLGMVASKPLATWIKSFSPE